VQWIAASGQPMQVQDWEDPGNPVLGMVLRTLDRQTNRNVRLAVLFNRSQDVVTFALPGAGWTQLPSGETWSERLPARSVCFCIQD
jgi:glycogen operon protein